MKKNRSRPELVKVKDTSYIIRTISEDGLVKPVQYGSGWGESTTTYDNFLTEEAAEDFCIENDIYDAIIMKKVSVRMEWPDHEGVGRHLMSITKKKS